MSDSGEQPKQDSTNWPVPGDVVNSAIRSILRARKEWVPESELLGASDGSGLVAERLREWEYTPPPQGARQVFEWGLRKVLDDKRVERQDRDKAKPLYRFNPTWVQDCAAETLEWLERRLTPGDAPVLSRNYCGGLYERLGKLLFECAKLESPSDDLKDGHVALLEKLHALGCVSILGDSERRDEYFRPDQDEVACALDADTLGEIRVALGLIGKKQAYDEMTGAKARDDSVREATRRASHGDIRVSLLRVLKRYSDPIESAEKWPEGPTRQMAVRGRVLWPKGGVVPESYLTGLVRDDLHEQGLAPIDDRHDVFELIVNDVLHQLESDGRVESLTGKDAHYQTLDGRTVKGEVAWRLRETAGGKHRGRPRSQPENVKADRQIHDAWVQYRNSNPGATFEQFAESRSKDEHPSELKLAHERYRKRMARLR